jgi:hypothetical protein
MRFCPDVSLRGTAEKHENPSVRSFPTSRFEPGFSEYEARRSVLRDNKCNLIKNRHERQGVADIKL